MPLAKERLPGAFSITIAMMTGVTDIVKKPRNDKSGIRRRLFEKIKRIINIGVVINEMMSILRRPNRSLSVPVKRLPTMPETSYIVKDAPANQRLEPCVVRKVGR